MESSPRHNDETILAELRYLKELLTLKITNSEEEIAILKKQLELNNERINIIELWRANSIGKFSVIMIAVGVGITLFTGWLAKHF